MNNVVRFCVLEAAAQLPSDVEKIPDGKSLFASQHGCDAIALDVVHASTELAVLAAVATWEPTSITALLPASITAVPGALAAAWEHGSVTALVDALAAAVLVHH